MIVGFIRYDITLGIPTPQFVHEDELSLSDIQRNRSIDNSLYVVVCTASDFIPYEQLQHEFVSTKLFVVSYIALSMNINFLFAFIQFIF